jgi:hypothetical protein
VGSLADRIIGLPPHVVLALVFLLPALEASTLLGVIFPGEIGVLIGGVVAPEGNLSLAAVIAASGAALHPERSCHDCRIADRGGARQGWCLLRPRASP